MQNSHDNGSTQILNIFRAIQECAQSTTWAVDQPHSLCKIHASVSLLDY